MARAELVVHFEAGDPEPVDGLCPRCSLPSLFTVPIHRICDHGVQLGAVTVCTTCVEVIR